MFAKEYSKIRLILFHILFLILTLSILFCSDEFMFKKSNFGLIVLMGVASVLMFCELLGKDNEESSDKRLRIPMMIVDVAFILAIGYTYLIK